jgi:Peptidase family M23
MASKFVIPAVDKFHVRLAKEVVGKFSKRVPDTITDQEKLSVITTAFSLTQSADLKNPILSRDDPNFTIANDLDSQFLISRNILTKIALTPPGKAVEFDFSDPLKTIKLPDDPQKTIQLAEDDKETRVITNDETISAGATTQRLPSTGATIQLTSAGIATTRVGSAGQKTTSLGTTKLQVAEEYIEVDDEPYYPDVVLLPSNLRTRQLSQAARPAGKAQMIQGHTYLDQAKKDIETRSREQLNNIERGKYGAELQQELINNPDRVREQVISSVRREEASALAFVHTDIARESIQEFPELAEGLRRRDLLLNHMQSQGLYDPSNVVQGDMQMGAFAPGYIIDVDAAQDPNASLTLVQVPDDQYLQQATEMRAQYIDNLANSNPGLPDLQSIAQRAKQFLGTGTKAAESAAVSGATTAVSATTKAASAATGVTAKLATSKLGSSAITGTTKLLGTKALGALAGVASGPIGWVAMLAPEVLKFLRDPGRALEDLGKGALKLGGVVLGGALALGTWLLLSVALQLFIPILLILLGLGLFVIIALFIINTGNMVIPSAPAITLTREAPNSANIVVRKTANVDRQIPNPPAGGTVITYTIEVTADRTLTNISYNNAYTLSQTPQLAPTIIGTQLLPPGQIAQGATDTQQYDLSIDARYANSLICDTLTVSADVESGGRQTSSASYCISVGDSPAIADCTGPTPTVVPVATGVLYSNDRQYAFPVAPYFGTTEGFSAGACRHWDGNRSTDIFPAGVTSVSSRPKYDTTVAYTAGTIAWVSNDATGGKNLAISGDDGGAYYYAHHCHIFVTTGQRVVAGQVLGLTDRTGTAAGANSPEHLHFSINRDPGGTGYNPGLCFRSGDGNVCPATDFTNNIEGYDRCRQPSQQCPGSPAIPNAPPGSFTCRSL